jgi:hypothetical protein
MCLAVDPTKNEVMQVVPTFSGDFMKILNLRLAP